MWIIYHREETIKRMGDCLKTHFLHLHLSPLSSGRRICADRSGSGDAYITKSSI